MNIFYRIYYFSECCMAFTIITIMWIIIKLLDNLYPEND